VTAPTRHSLNPAVEVASPTAVETRRAKARLPKHTLAIYLRNWLENNNLRNGAKRYFRKFNCLHSITEF
jgi:hypothetical protein